MSILLDPVRGGETFVFDSSEDNRKVLVPLLLVLKTWKEMTIKSLAQKPPKPSSVRASPADKACSERHRGRSLEYPDTVERR